MNGLCNAGLWPFWIWIPGVLILTALLFLLTVFLFLGFRHIPNNQVGVVEKLWSCKGSLKEGGVIALKEEAGYQADLLRGGNHWFFWPWLFRIHPVPLTVRLPEPLNALCVSAAVWPKVNDALFVITPVPSFPSGPTTSAPAFTSVAPELLLGVSMVRVPVPLLVRPTAPPTLPPPLKVES